MTNTSGNETQHRPLCFIIMPFGKKKDARGNTIDFDYVYNEMIRKVIEQCELTPIRADEEMMGGIIQKPMYERLVLCDYAIADLTTANANVFYELGIRYTAKPFTTFSIFETESKPPFDLNDVRCFPYMISDGKINDLTGTIEKLVTYIKGVREQKETDSPVYQLLDGITFSHNLSDEKVSMLRQKTEFNELLRRGLRQIIASAAPQSGKESEIKKIENRLGDKGDWDAATCIDIMLAYRSVESFGEMVRFIDSLPAFLRRTTLIREQYGFALNRAGRREEAIRELQQLIEEHGPDSETCGILGRVYKDMYNRLKNDNPLQAEGYLNKAINTYLEGFKADLRDFYPGINAVTLMKIKKDPRASDLAKVVEFAVNTFMEKKSRKAFSNIAASYDEYWLHATRLELAVIQNDEQKAMDYLSDCLCTPSLPLQRNSTADNLSLFTGGQEWVRSIENQLRQPVS